MDSKNSLESSDIYNLIETYGSRSMSDFQSRYFVVNSQVTDYKRVHQALLEIESRVGGRKQIERNVKKTEIQKKIKQRELENENDELLRELILVDIEQLDYDLSVYDKKYRICIEELETFCNIVKDLVPNKEILDFYKEHNDEEERYYWILRMGKQAALDISASGRIGQGNMDSIAMMPLKDQEKVIGVALKYNALLQNGITSIEAKINKELLLSPDKINNIDTIIDKGLLLNSENETVQPATES